VENEQETYFFPDHLKILIKKHKTDQGGEGTAFFALKASKNMQKGLTSSS